MPGPKSRASPKEPPFGWLPGKDGFKALKWLFDCARFKINLRLTCRYCGNSVVIDAPGHWWACYKSGKDEHIATFVKRLYCKQCLNQSGEKRRHPKVEQTSAPPDGPFPYSLIRALLFFCFSSSFFLRDMPVLSKPKGRRRNTWRSRPVDLRSPSARYFDKLSTQDRLAHRGPSCRLFVHPVYTFP